MTDTDGVGAIGRTPLLALDRAVDVDADVYGKAEWFNLVERGHGGGSVKTRIAASMLDAAEARGEFDGSRTVIEASSGNTGAALARIGGARGHDVEIVAPDDAGAGKVAAIREAGGRIRFVDADRGYDAFVEECHSRIEASESSYYHPDQYANPANPAVHAATTGPEIWRGTGGTVTRFVAGAGTGGTVVGVSHALADRGVTVHGFEPATTDHGIAGLKHMHAADTFVPDTFDPAAVDSMDTIRTTAACERARRARRRYADRRVPIVDPGRWDEATVRDHLRVDGEFLLGPSGGACLGMVERLDERGVLDADDVVVVPLPDRGDRYPERDLWADVLGGG